MLSIVCFGDSNTWGKVPGTDLRHPFHIRWPGIVQSELGARARVNEEGLNGRTTVWDDPLKLNRNGRLQIETALETHTPVDLLILMLGTNDLKKRLRLTPFEVAEGILSLVQISQHSQYHPKRILVVSPPLLSKTSDEIAGRVFEFAVEKSRLLSKFYESIAKYCNVDYLDGSFVQADLVDGVHLSAISHLELGKSIAKKTSEIFHWED